MSKLGEREQSKNNARLNENEYMASKQLNYTIRKKEPLMRLPCLYRRRARASVKERGNGLAKAHIQQYKNTYGRTHIHTYTHAFSQCCLFSNGESSSFLLSRLVVFLYFKSTILFLVRYASCSALRSVFICFDSWARFVEINSQTEKQWNRWKERIKRGKRALIFNFCFFLLFDIHFWMLVRARMV